MMDELLKHISIETILTCAAGYAAIRADLKLALRDSTRALEESRSAHDRISGHISDHHVKK